MSKEWTSQADWGDWTLVDLDAATTPGSLLVAAGHTEGTATISYEYTDWAEWAWFRVPGIRPECTRWCFRFKTATTSGGLAGATWSDYLDGIDEDGVMNFDLGGYCANNAGFDVGPWIMLELTLKTS